jgi:hypothetical protein
MPLKTHLIIVSIIIASVFLGWQAMRLLSRAEQVVAPSGNLIQLVRANYGLNCNSRTLGTRASRNTSAGKFEYDNQDESNIYPDNARKVVEPLCQGKPWCRVTNSTNLLGMDPAPGCFEKELVIEYRCYSFDRLWKLVVPANEKGEIDCSKVQQPN